MRPSGPDATHCSSNLRSWGKLWRLAALLPVILGNIGPSFANELGQQDTLANTTPDKALMGSISRGKKVFQHYCVLCHGINADGLGRAAKLYQPRPSNLVLSDKNAQYKELIIRQGGAAIGRSNYMPPWGKELNDEQIRDVVSYLTSIVKQ